MGALQPLHLVLILLIVLVIFGAGRLSEVGGAVGKSVRDFRSSFEDRSKAAPATSAAAAGPQRSCSKCGTGAAAGARFCAKCGAAFPD